MLVSAGYDAHTLYIFQNRQMLFFFHTKHNCWSSPMSVPVKTDFTLHGVADRPRYLTCGICQPTVTLFTDRVFIHSNTVITTHVNEQHCASDFGLLSAISKSIQYIKPLIIFMQWSIIDKFRILKFYNFV